MSASTVLFGLHPAGSNRQVINQHHGTIAVESAPGHGSTFTVVLPRWGKRKII